MRKMEGVGDGSASSVLAIKAWGPEFGNWSPHKRPGTAALVCNLSTWGGGGGPWSSLASQLNLISKLSQ